jgi:hypothetical protein
LNRGLIPVFYSGKDTYNDQQLGFVYAAAANVGFKVFISFDFSYWTSSGKHALVLLAMTVNERHSLADVSTMSDGDLYADLCDATRTVYLQQRCLRIQLRG